PADIALVHSGEVGEGLLRELAVPSKPPYAIADALVHNRDDAKVCHQAGHYLALDRPPNGRLSKPQPCCPFDRPHPASAPLLSRLLLWARFPTRSKGVNLWGKREKRSNPSPTRT